MDQKRFTLGFIFTPSFNQVLLIHKNRPDWQRGKLNGIGGKMEDGESYVFCIVRETQEETGLLIPPDQWTTIGKFGNSIWIVSVFASVYEGNVASVKSKTDEQIEWISTMDLPERAINNLRWIIPLCVDRLNDPSLQSFSAIYDG